ncbi:MAG TPA: AraC family transcriptional regulator [Alphaproteobacteria bacterium]|nr:AraC family transcriptional regulator [Alphaproteobacteria bacterium]
MRENPRLFVLFEELLEAMEHGYADSRLLYASQILAHLLGLVIWTYRSGSDRNVTTAQKVAQSITYMKQHLDQSATVASFAALANLSEPYYRSLFRRQTGYAPMGLLHSPSHPQGLPASGHHDAEHQRNRPGRSAIRTRSIFRMRSKR